MDISQQQGPFDLLLTDVVLPGKSGLELINDLVERHADIPVLLCSGYADDKSQWAGIKERRFPFIAKPFSVGELLDAVKNAMRKKEKN